MYSVSITVVSFKLLVFCFMCLVIAQVNASVTKKIDDVGKPTTKRPEGTGFMDQVVQSSLELIQSASLHTSFLFFPRKTGSEYIRVKVGDKSKLLKAGFDVRKKTKILIHGWTRNGTDPFSIAVRQALLKNEDMNILSVDWPVLSQKLYTVAYVAVPYIGNRTALFIDFLVKDVGVKLSSIHAIGYSLGAHVAGTAGEGITSGKIPRITGLDPAGPFFAGAKEGRLDASDAEFVDVIHTSAGTVGYEGPCGTVDFYPNGGNAPQPGCDAFSPSCSHARAYQYFVESVDNKNFRARKCKDWDSFKKGVCSESNSAIMGYNVDIKAKGVFFLETNSKSPYAKATKEFIAKFLNTVI